ncbi:type II secretion system protein N [Natronospira bacteriovora]|uniref:Type II secretion system protein N n=1 Tax=Natronospira bacteriovora TaxID=3069753 RepID=A0ABU0W5F3_9GAMM|nr:type II secretion system protein N [Natronospira sp. AB-CW4]MDQ2069244.1 type II secretion system protein N [Natronospira sp. AB-CW4]
MKRIFLLTGFGVLLFLAFLFARAPAGLLLVALPELDEVHVHAPAGTVWNGRFRHVQAGPLRLESVEWSLRKAPLLMGRADIDFRARINQGRVEGQVRAHPNGEVRIRQAIGQQIPLASLAPLFNQPPGMVSGDGAFEIRDARIKGTEPVSADAELRVFNLGVNMMGNHQLGNFAAQLQGSDGEFTLSFRDVGENAPFSVSGDAEFSLPQRRYSINGRIRARDDAPENLASMLPYLGQADEQGAHPLRLSGRIQ